MIKRLISAVLAALLSAALMTAGFAFGTLDAEDPVGQTFENVRSPHMTEGGLPSDTDFFTDADFGESRLTVLNLWDSSCLFCRLGLPNYQQISVDYADRGVSVCGVVSTRMGGTYPAAYGYLQEYGVTYVNVIPDAGMQAIVFQNANTPQTFIVDGNGTVVDYFSGYAEVEEIASRLDAILNLYGDADCDGAISFADVSSTYVFMLGSAQLSAQGAINADFNKDGAVSFGDISELYLYIIGG